MAMYTMEDFIDKNLRVVLRSRQAIQLFLAECTKYTLWWNSGHSPDDPNAFRGVGSLDKAAIYLNSAGRLMYSTDIGGFGYGRKDVGFYEFDISKTVYRIRLPQGVSV